MSSAAKKRGEREGDNKRGNISTGNKGEGGGGGFLLFCMMMKCLSDGGGMVRGKKEEREIGIGQLERIVEAYSVDLSK